MIKAKTFPQFADVRDIVGTVASLPGAHGVALTLNERGAVLAALQGLRIQINSQHTHTFAESYWKSITLTSQTDGFSPGRPRQ